MRVVPSNDVTPASEARHRAVVWHFTMFIVVIVVFSPSSGISPDDVTDPADKTSSTHNGKFKFVHTNVVFVCDSSSSAHCQLATVHSWSLRQLYSVYRGYNSKPCHRHNSSCSSKNTIPHSFSSNNSNAYNNQNESYVLQAEISDTLSLLIHISFHNVSGGVYELLHDLNYLATTYSSHVLICIGDNVTVQTAAIVADALGIPVIGYVTKGGNTKSTIQGGSFTSLNPGPEAQGMVLAQIIGKFNMKQTAVIIQDGKVADGFLQGIRKVANDQPWDVFHVLSLNKSTSNEGLLDSLIDLSTTGWKLMVVHTDPDVMVNIIHAALSTRLYNTGHAWFLSEHAYSRDGAILSQLPEGLLAIESMWLGGVPDIMVNALDHVVTAFALLFGEGVTTSIADNVPYHRTHPSSIRNSLDTFSTHQENSEDFDYISNWTWSREDRKEFLRNLRISVFCSRFITVEHGDPQCSDDVLLRFINGSEYSHYRRDKPNTTKRRKRPLNRRAGYNIHSKKHDVPGNNHREARGPAYSLLNTMTDGMQGLMWSRVGYITIKGWQNLRTVLWPGHNIYGPASNAVKTYKIVTREAEPFVFITHKVNRKEDCLVELVCLQVFNSSKRVLSRVMEDFQTDGKEVNKLYTIHCCWGIALELMQTLSYDLNFNFVVYFVNDTDYGTFRDGQWTGMVGDLVDGAADAVAGAFSITAQRMNQIHYTEPFFNNEYGQASKQDGNDVSIWAFTSPFSAQVWMCIFMSSIVAGLATAFLEWHSPFGLNPRGRKRTKNYGLGSGLLMVMVLITGHTINIKAPKSWPAKLIQNVWAGLAIFIMASYTANLAAYLAGQSAVTTATNIFDPGLLTKRAAVIASSAVESFLNKINPTLGKRTKEHYVDSTVQAINLLSEEEIDVYFDDTALLEYGLARYDKNCKVHISGKGFGSDGYAFGLARNSWWLQIPMSNMISLYTDSGLVQDLARKYLSRPQCTNFVVGTATAYGMEHTGGLFLILLSSVLCSILLLICEHLVYYFAVPWMRSKSPHSFWKTENMAFISQRVSRVVRSERLYSQKQAAQEMIKIVKQRDFTRLIQKNELQKRKNPVQKKVKTKAEVFQEITANIVSYHRQLQSASEDASSETADFQQGLSVDLTTNDTGISPDLVGVNNTGYTTTDSLELAVDDYYLRQISDCEEESRETAFTFDNVGDFSKDSDDLDSCNQGGHKFRRMSSTSWAFPPRQLSEDFTLQRHSTFRRPLKHTKKKANPHPSPFVYHVDEDRKSNSPSKQSAHCDLHHSSPHHHHHLHLHHQPHPHQYHQNDQLFQCTDSDNEIDNSLPPPVLSSSSLCLSSLSANSSSFFPSPPSSRMQSPLEDKKLCPIIKAPPPDHTRDANVPGSFRGFHSALPENNTQHLHLHPPRLLKIPLDPVVLDTSHSAPNTPLGAESVANNSHPSRVVFPETSPRREVETCGDQTFPTPSNRVYNNDHDPEDADFIESSAEPTLVPNHKKKGSLSIHDKGPSDLNKNMRKYSDLSEYRLPSSNLSGVNITQRRKSYDKQSRDYFKRNIKLKDNRVKSTLRHHAMSGYQSTLPADFIDECTLEALSKEDLLVLWKKSEIELEGRLNEVLERNRRMGQAIEYLSQDEKSETLTEV